MKIFRDFKKRKKRKDTRVNSCLGRNSYFFPRFVSVAVGDFFPIFCECISRWKIFYNFLLLFVFMSYLSYLYWGTYANNSSDISFVLINYFEL